MSCKYAQSEKGQGIIEYAGMIVMSTLLVGGMMTSTKQLMPVIFTALSHNNAAALSDAPPAPASSMRSPAPLSSLAPALAPGSSALAIPLANIKSPQFEMPPAPQLSISQLSSGKQPTHASTVPSATVTPAPELRPAALPNIFPGPSPAPAPAMAPPPKVAPAPKLAPIPPPAPTS